MSKKKKKAKSGSKHLSQKAILQRLEKERRIGFYKKAEQILKAINAQEIMSDLSVRELEQMYRSRFQTHKVVSGSSFDFGPTFYRAIQRTVNSFMKERFFNFQGSEQKFPYQDYFTIVITLKHWARTLPDNSPKKKTYLQALKPLLDFCASLSNPEIQFELFLRILSIQITEDPEKLVTYFVNDHERLELPYPYIRFRVGIYMVRPDVKTVKFEGHNRSVYSYISTLNIAHIPRLRAGDISPKSLIGNMELTVYYQKHMMERLKERIDCFSTHLLKIEIDESLRHPQLIPIGEMRALLTFTFYGYKLGYFVVEVIAGIAVLRTFLFLTNDGTPEGDRLKKELGLNKLDKTYTQLDRLSTFLHSDIREDEQLQQLLKKSGCDGLLHIAPKIIEASTKSDSHIDAAHIKKYLSLETPDCATKDNNDELSESVPTG